MAAHRETTEDRAHDRARNDMITDWQSLTHDQQQFAIGVLMSTNPQAFRDAVTFTKAQS